MTIPPLTNELVHKYIPNILAEARGERSIADKLEPFAESARIWLESEILGTEDFLDDAHLDFVMKIIVIKAFAEAVPSLDLTITPTGMAVVSTDTLSPASKERVNRLIESLDSSVKSMTTVLVDICRRYDQWRLGFGRKFCTVFLYDPAGVRISQSVHFDFDAVRRFCLSVEPLMAESFLGHHLMNILRAQYHSYSLLPGADALVQRIRHAELSLLREYAESGQSIPDYRTLWHLCRPIVNDLNYFPDYKEIWSQEMGDKFNTEGFINNIKGGFYF